MSEQLAPVDSPAGYISPSRISVTIPSAIFGCGDDSPMLDNASREGHSPRVASLEIEAY